MENNFFDPRDKGLNQDDSVNDLNNENDFPWINTTDEASSGRIEKGDYERRSWDSDDTPIYDPEIIDDSIPNEGEDYFEK